MWSWSRRLKPWQRAYLIMVVSLPIELAAFYVALFVSRPWEPIGLGLVVALVVWSRVGHRVSLQAEDGFLKENTHLERWVRREEVGWIEGFVFENRPAAQKLPIGAVLLWRLIKRGVRFARARRGR